MSFLNYHHLRYFRAIAKEGNLTRASKHLHVSQSALSLQLKKLEDSFGHELFTRDNKRLALTEAGKIALRYADEIFKMGDELLDTIQRGAATRRQAIRIGAVATLSRNFQMAFVAPLLGQDNCELVIHSGSLRQLLSALQAHALDIVLSNQEVFRDASTDWHSHLLDEQSVSLVGKPPKPRRWKFPDDIEGVPLVLPCIESNIRTAFDRITENLDFLPTIAAEVEDMAMLRLFARQSGGLTLVPPVVVRDELKNKTLLEYHQFDEIKETFYAITPTRTFPNPLTHELLKPWR